MCFSQIINVIGVLVYIRVVSGVGVRIHTSYLAVLSFYGLSDGGLNVTKNKRWWFEAF